MHDRIRSVTGQYLSVADKAPIVLSLARERLAALVPNLVIAHQRLPAVLGLRSIEPAPRNEGPHCVNAVRLVDVRHDGEADAQRRRDLDPALAAAELAHRYIVGSIVCPVEVAAVFEHALVERESGAAVLVIVDDMHLSADVLGKPNRHRVPHPEIPPGIDEMRWLIRDATDAPVCLSCLHFLAKVAADDA